MASAISAALSSSSSSSSFATPSLPASATPGVLTSPNAAAAAASTDLRSTAGVMAALPRLFVKLASFGYFDVGFAHIPDNAAYIPPVAEAATTSSSTTVAAAAVAGTATSAAAAAEVTAAAAAVANQASKASTAAAGGATRAAEAATRGVAHEGLRSVESIFTYMSSKWAVLCLFMTVLLNRTMIYASLRRPIQLPLRVRLMMRVVPILMFAYQIFHIMAAMRCQTSVQFRGDIDPPPTDYFFHAIGKVGTWWMDDRDVCEAIGMIPDSDWIDLASSIQDTENPEVELEPPKGSADILWPLYKTLSLSQFIEAFSCALIGRTTATETGMTLLEHSLAFAEAESHSIRKVYRLETSPEEGDAESPPKVFKIKGHPIVPVEVLYICLISALSHLTSHALAIFNLQSRFRLLSTGLFGLAFLGGFAFSLVVGGGLAILEYPTVSVVGFIPHLLIFSGIAVCGFIYSLALFLSSLFPPSGQRSFNDGFNNLRANLSLSSVNISLGEDFYTTLLKLGFMCLTAASEATYLNEGRSVRIPGWTWLEAERSKLSDSRRSLLGVPREPETPQASNPPGCNGPYAKERKDLRGMMAASKTKRSTSGTARWSGAAEMLRGVGAMVGRIGFGSAARVLGLTSNSTPSSATDTDAAAASAQLLQDARGSSPGSDQEDAEEIYRRFLRGQTPLPDVDTSGEYIPSSPSFSRETTPFSSSSSVYSSRASSLTPSTASDHDYDTDSSMLTVTQRRHNRNIYSEHPLQPTISDIFATPAELARLLDPQTPEDRANARMLARHLRAPSVLTRRGFHDAAPTLEGERESGELEELLITRRRQAQAGKRRPGKRKPMPSSSSFNSNSSMGSYYKIEEEEEVEEVEDYADDDEENASGPVCVVCYSAPRTIIIWPCRCLSLCEDCRVCLAMKNFVNCVTCRQKSEGFSRIYIP